MDDPVVSLAVGGREPLPPDGVELGVSGLGQASGNLVVVPGSSGKTVL